MPRLPRFIHIPKSAGTSLVPFLDDCKVDFLYGVSGKRNGKHRPIVQWKDEKSFKFTVIRNPYTRVVSWFLYLQRLFPEKFTFTFDDYVTAKVNLDEFATPNVWIPQYFYLCDVKETIKKKRITIHDINYNNIEPKNLLIERFLRFETINEDVKEMFNLQKDMPHLNKSTYDDPMAYYNDKTKKIVQEHFALDFEILGYEK